MDQRKRKDTVKENVTEGNLICLVRGGKADSRNTTLGKVVFHSGELAVEVISDGILTKKKGVITPIDNFLNVGSNYEVLVDSSVIDNIQTQSESKDIALLDSHFSILKKQGVAINNSANTDSFSLLDGIHDFLRQKEHELRSSGAFKDRLTADVYLDLIKQFFK